MNKQSVGNPNEWFTLPVYDGMCVLGLESKGHLVQLQYLPLTNTIVGITNEDCIVTFDASSGESLQNFKIGCEIGKNLLLRYHNCTGSIVLSDGFSMGYRCQSNSLFHLKTILQVPVASHSEFVAVELSISEAELLLDVMRDNAILGTIDSSNRQCVNEMIEMIEKEVSSHSEGSISTSTGCYPCKSTSKSFRKWGSIYFSMQHSILRSTCQTILNCYDSKSTKDGLLEEGYHGQHRILDGLAVVSSMLNQLTLLHSEEKTESATLPDSSKGVMCSELSRRLSFCNWPHPNYRFAQPSTMAEAGFFHQPAAAGDDRAICFACNVCLVCWEPTDEPWSEHERHSPLCPFVRCEPTLNVPIAITLARQPASSNPLLKYSRTRDNHIDFLCVGESSSLIVAASKVGDFIFWDASSGMPVLRFVSTLKKSDVLSELVNQIANQTGDEAEQLNPFQADFDMEDLSLSSLCLIDSAEVQPTSNFTDTSPLMANAETNLESEHADDAKRSYSETKQPVLAIGAVVKLTSSRLTQECLAEEMYYSLLIFATSESFSISSHEDKLQTVRDTLSGQTAQQFSETESSNNDGDLTDPEEKPHEEGNSGTNTGFYDAPYLAGPAGQMKVIQVVIIDHKESIGNDHKLRLQVIKNISKTKYSAKLIATSSPKKVVLTEASQNFSSDIVDSDTDNMYSRHCEDSHEQPSLESGEKFGRVMAFNLTHSDSSVWVMPKSIRALDKGKTWITTPIIVQMIEMPRLLASATRNDEADGDDAASTFSQATTETNLESEAQYNFRAMEHPIMLTLGNDGLLRLIDVKLMKVVHEAKPDDTAANEKFTAITYCSNIDQVCAVTSTGKVSFLKIGRHLYPGNCFDGVSNNNARIPLDSVASSHLMKPSPKEDDLIANHPLKQSSLETLLQLTKFLKLEPRFQAKTPPHWTELQLKELTNVLNCPPSVEDTFQTIPRKARMGQSNVSVQVKQQRRHLRHPNEHYAFDAHLNMRAWRLYHESAKQEIVELIFPNSTNISHIDLQFVLTRKLKSGSDVQVTLMTHYDSSRGKSTDVNSVGAVNDIHQRIDLLDPKPSSDGSFIKPQHPNLGRSDILFGPVLISKYVDPTGLGGVITIASKRFTRSSRHKSLLVLVENVPDGTLTSEHDSDERNRQFRSRACMQEVSITVFKSKRVDIIHERAQRFGLLCSRTLHAELLSSLCDGSADNQKLVSISLSQRVMALDILNWVAALEIADPNECCMTDGAQKNNSNVLESLPQCQSLAYLLCFLESKETSQSEFEGRNHSADLENLDKSGHVKFNLTDFLINCFLKSGREVGVRALRFIFHTISLMDATGQFQSQNICGREMLYKAVLNSLKYAVTNRVNSVYGIHCLYRILYATLLAAPGQTDMKIQIKGFETKLSDCVNLLTDLTSLMEEHINPFSAILRSVYGLYTSPFDMAVMASDIGYQRSTVASKLKSQNIPDDKYFGEEDVDMFAFMTPQRLDCHKALAACGISDGYYKTQLSCIECQPLHFNCIQLSDGCTFGSGVAATDNWSSFQNGLLADSVGSSHKDIWRFYPWTLPESSKSELKSSGYVDDVLECYTDLEAESSHGTPVLEEILQQTDGEAGDLGTQNIRRHDPEKKQGAPQKSSESNASKELHNPDPKSKMNINYFIPVLSFIPPRPTQLNISRMHSGGRRSAILDFGHIIELSDINIPLCKSLSSFIVEAWPCNMKNCPTIDATEFFTIAISLDICYHDFTASPITPTVLTRYVRITAIGRYGTSNAQTVVSLGSFYGRPACIRLCALEGTEHNHSKRTMSPETVVEFPSHGGDGDVEILAMRITDADVVTDGVHAIECYLTSLQNYLESLTGQYELARAELKSLISISSSNLSSFHAHFGNTYQIPSKEAVTQAYKKCTALQLQLSRIHHAIALIESINGSVERGSTKTSSESNKSLISPQIEMHCELMLNLLLSLCPQILKLEEQIICDTIFTSSSAEILFKYLIMGLPHPRIRAQATGVLLSCYAQFPNWGSFLVSCLTRYFTVAYSRNLSPSQSHFFCNILVLSQRCLAIPGKGEDVIESLMSLISITLPKAGELFERTVNFKLLTLVLLLVSHLTETIRSMNESFVLKSNPQIFPLISTGVSGTDDQESLLRLILEMNGTSPSPEEAESSERTTSIPNNNAKTHMGQLNFSKQATGSSDKLNTSRIPSSSVQATFPKSSSWDFMSLSGFQDKCPSSVNHYAKILKWLEAVHAKLQSQRGELEQLGLEECSLRKKISTLYQNTVNDDGKRTLLENALSVTSKKASDCFKIVLGYRRTLDHKVITSLLQSKPITKNSKEPVKLPHSSSFIKVPVELCHRVVKQILALLLQHDIAIPADFVVLSCKVCSQLSYWATLQCINENRPVQNFSEDCKKYFSPLSLTNLLSSDQLTKLLLLSAGVHPFSYENVSDAIPTTYCEGPWICYAFRNLLFDLLKYENLGFPSCCSDDSNLIFENVECPVSDCKDFGVTDANPMPHYHENSTSQTSNVTSHHKLDDLDDSRIKVVDSFIRLSEVLISDVKFLAQSQEVSTESVAGYGDMQIHGYPESMDVKLNKTKTPANIDEVAGKTDKFLQRMKEYYLEATQPTGLWNSKCPEGTAIIHPISSHVYDQRSVHGISRNILLTSKMYSISYMESVAKSLGNLSSRSQDENEEHRDFFKGCASTADCLKTATALQIAINRILDDFTDNDADFSAICDLLLLIQHSHKLLPSICTPNQPAAMHAIGHTGMKKLLNIATADSLTIGADNLRLLNLILHLLNSFIHAETDHATDAAQVQRLFEHDFGMSNLFTKILSAKFGASCLGHAHVHRSLAMLGPSACASLERSFQNLHVLAANITVQDCPQVSQPTHTISEKLKMFYLNILSTLIQNSAFDFTLQTPVDGQVAFVKAILKMYYETSSKMTFDGDPMILTKIVDGISELAFQYLSWSCINVNRNQNCKIEPSALFPNTSPVQQTTWLSNSPKDELMLNLLKLGSLLCQVDVVISREPLTQQPVSDMVFEDENTIQNLLSALSISKGSTTIQDSVDNFLSKMQTSATTTCDGVLILLLSLFNSRTSPLKKIQCVMAFLKRTNVRNGFGQQKILKRTSCMSYPLLTFTTQVFSSSGVLLDAFIAEGGVKLLLVNLVASLNQGFDPRNRLVSQAMKYITAASRRSEALNFNEPDKIQTESIHPVTKGFNPHSKMAMKEKYYGYSKAQTDGAMFVSTPHSRLTANSWRTEEKIDFATIATVECSDLAAPPADSLLKHKAIHRRARTPVWSYHFQGNTNWVSLTLHFPAAFVLNYVKILPMIPSLSTCPSAVILELNQSGIPEDSFYHPLSTPLATSGMGDIILVPPTEEVVLSMKIFLKRPLESSSIGLTRISVTGTSFVSYKAPVIKPSSFMKINSTNFTASKDYGPNTSSSIWILLLYHLVRLHDNDVLQEIQRSSTTVDEMVPTLCTLLELDSLPSISHAIETILLEVTVAAMPVALIDCIFGKHGKARYPHYLDKTSQSRSDYFVHIIYQMCITKDAELQLRLERCLYWITNTTLFAATNDNLNAVNADFIHAISCGLWQCSDTESAKSLISDSLLKNVYDSIQGISRSRISKSPSSHYSSRLKESLDWFLCSICQVDANCYFSLLKWMNLDQNILKAVSLSISQIETLASTTQTKRTADIFLSQNIMMLFANGLQRFCQTQVAPDIDESNVVDAMVEVTPNNVVVILKFFSHLCNTLPIQRWLGTEQGTRCWRALLWALDHPMPDITQGAITESLLMDLRESTVNLIKQITRCNQRNCEVVSSAICNMISSHSGKPRGRSSFSGFLRSLLFQVILEDETVTAHIKSCSEKNVQCKKMANNASDILRHPMFGTGHYNYVFNVGIMSSVENISSIVTGRHGASGKHERMYKNKEPVSKPEMNFQKSPTYASIPKSTHPAPGFSLTPEDLAQIQTSAKNAQDKRRAQTGNTQSLLLEDAHQSDFLKLTFTCDELKLDDLNGDDTMLQILERYHAQETYPFFHCIQLEASCTSNASATQGNSHAGDMDIDKSIPSKERMMEKQNQRSKESDAHKILKTMFQVFAESGGLSLIACHLPSLTLDAGPVSVNDFAKAILTEERRRVRTDSLSYMDYVSEWMGFDDDDCLYTQFDDGPLIHPGVEMSITDGLPKPHVPTRSSSDAQPTPMKCCVPSFTITALRSFLQVPLFAEELLKDYGAAKCLMRLALGVMDDGKRQFCPSVTLSSELSLLPFKALSRLLSENDYSTPSGLIIREAMTFQTISLHTVVACISRYCHIEPTSDTTAGKLLKFVLSQGFSSHSTQKKSVTPTEKNYWAQGTGFGTGSTSSDWNPEDVMKEQKKDEEFLTTFIQILANFVCPASDFEDKADHEIMVTKCVSINESLVETLMELVIASGLISAVASYLRNDSVLDISSHVTLYQALLSMIRSFSLCPPLSQLLINWMPLTKDTSTTEDVVQGSIVDLLTKMKRCIDTYSSRLEALNTSLDVHEDEEFSYFVANVKNTEHMLRTIMQDSDENLHTQDEGMNTLLQSPTSMQSLEETYINIMKELQFDTAILVQENEKGNYLFPSGHHYNTLIKESSNVTDAARARRLAQEAVTLSNSLPLSLSSTVFVRCDEERLDVMKVLITGPVDTPYANGCFEFDVYFPSNYNKSPPLVNLRTTGNQSVRFNPNLYNDGKVCLSILNTWHGRPEERWNPRASSFLQILVSIQSLIFVKEPYFNEPGYERSRGTPSGQQCSLDYDANIQQATVKWAMLDQLKKPSGCFRNVILNHFWMKKDEISKQCDTWLANMKKRASQQKSRKSIAQHYSALQKYVSQLQTELRKLLPPPTHDKSEESDE